MKGKERSTEEHRVLHLCTLAVDLPGRMNCLPMSYLVVYPQSHPRISGRSWWPGGVSLVSLRLTILRMSHRPFLCHSLGSPSDQEQCCWTGRAQQIPQGVGALCAAKRGWRSAVWIWMQAGMPLLEIASETKSQSSIDVTILCPISWITQWVALSAIPDTFWMTDRCNHLRKVSQVMRFLVLLQMWTNLKLWQFGHY